MESHPDFNNRREITPPTQTELRSLYDLSVEIDTAITNLGSTLPLRERALGIVRDSGTHRLTVAREVHSRKPGRLVVGKLELPRSLDAADKIYRLDEVEPGGEIDLEIDEGSLRDSSVVIQGTKDSKYARLLGDPQSFLYEAEWEAEMQNHAAAEMAAAVPGSSQVSAKEITDLTAELNVAWQLRRVELGIADDDPRLTDEIA